MVKLIIIDEKFDQMCVFHIKKMIKTSQLTKYDFLVLIFFFFGELLNWVYFFFNEKMFYIIDGFNNYYNLKYVKRITHICAVFVLTQNFTKLKMINFLEYCIGCV